MLNKAIKPAITHRVELIPPQLAALHQWIHWAATEQKDDGRFNKIPKNCEGININAHEPRYWRSLADAVDTFSSEHHSGIAIVLNGQKHKIQGSDQEGYLIGVDCDKCVTGFDASNNPILTPKAQKVVATIASYWELSPSGSGIRAFFYADNTVLGQNKQGFEIYCDKRFLTVTGHGSGNVRRLGLDEVDDLIKLLFDHVKQPTGAARSTGAFGSSRLAQALLGKSQQPQETAESIKAFENALNSIPSAIERDTWMKVVLAGKAHGFSCCELKLREWSKLAGPYDREMNRYGYDPTAFDNVWKCEPHSISYRTLYYIAKQFDDEKNTPSFGDTRHGRLFAELHRGRLRYCYQNAKWLHFNSLHWEWCTDSVTMQAAKETAMDLHDQATKAFQINPQSTDAKKCLSQAREAFNLKRLEAMITCAASEPEMHIGEISELDADPMLLGCRNGVINLRDATLLEPSADLFITKIVNAEYDLSATCPLWEDFLHQITLGDPDTEHYLQKMAGYFLTGEVKEEVLHFFYGFGRNGKSVFANVLTRLLGDYVLTAPAEMLMRRDKGSSSNDVARLVGVRLLMANETRNGQAFDDLMIKTLVSTERMSARFLYHEFFDFWPTHKILIRGNHKPLITDETEGAWRRVRLIPFDLKLSESEVDWTLESSLMREASGILRWCVQGCLLWQSEGLQPSAKITSASAVYRNECDLVGEFLEDYILTPAGQISQQVLWNEWRVWCQQNGINEGSKKSLTRRLESRGIRALGWKGNVRQYTGIERRTDH